VSVQETEALCQRDTGDGDEHVHEVPGERSHKLGHRGEGCTAVGVAEVLEQMVVTLQHVLAKDTAGGVGMLRCVLHVGVLVEQVFSWNSVQSVRVPAPQTVVTVLDSAIIPLRDRFFIGISLSADTGRQVTRCSTRAVCLWCGCDGCLHHCVNCTLIMSPPSL